MIRKITRILSIVFILFVSLFTLDVVGEEKWLLALMMHLIPTFVFIIITVIAWKKEFIGGILWLILGIVFLIMSLQSYVIYVPTIIIGGLNLWVAKSNTKKEKI
jgi:glucan phosphoethanolaminetransferase (alkaline phosphatase superfamily)